ncbi:putative protein associated with differentiation 4 [Trypanosoma cruzi]|uniref:Nodulin-like domain-containing protein n=1 Tax=Trypanosoma cruzi TaxID=5693 RepID=A0A2V2X476_TRYCR|nr:putative protein associated with differentiation 4 [Trypanosoma cruzi]
MSWTMAVPQPPVWLAQRAATLLCHMASFFDHFGPKPIFILSMVLFPLGALLFALSFRGTIEGSVVRLSVFNGMLTLGCTLYDVVYMMTIMSHFPNSRGPVVAVLKSYIGLGSAIVGSIQLAFFDGEAGPLLLFSDGAVFCDWSCGFLPCATPVVPPDWL